MSWKHRAACKGRGDVDWDDFGPEQVLICAGCQVRPECLHAGLQEPEAAGTWGMTSEAQRRRLSAGKAKVADIWSENLKAAQTYTYDRLKGVTPTWQMR